MENLETVVDTPIEEGTQTAVDAQTGNADVNEAANTEAETVVNTGADNPQQNVGGAKDFSVALNKRVEAEKAKIERKLREEYGADLELASRVRNMYGGKADADIMADMLSSQANEFAKANNITPELAKRLLQLEANNAPVTKTQKVEAKQQNDDRMQELAAQIDDIRDNDGVDMVEVIRNDETIRKNVAEGRWDINRAYSHYLSNQGGRMPQVNRGTQSAKQKVSFKDMSDKEFDRIDAQLKRGVRVDI